jgi:cytochrome bd ubiquinol oxidase subunit II
MWIEGAAAFLALSLVLYVVCGGADFGAGMVEFALRGRGHRERNQDVIYHALGPVWEANHIWLILVVVILFSAFPKAFAVICTRFHIPLTLVLLGIVFRGCAFTFRHYDVQTDATHSVYTIVFEAMSILTPFFLGVVAGASFLTTDPVAGASFRQLYVDSWLNWFSLMLGAFTCANCLLLASVYLLGETADRDLQGHYRRLARIGLVAVIVSGAGVFAAAAYEGVPLLREFFSDRLSVAAWVGATLCAIVLLALLERLNLWQQRLAVGTMVTCILLGWFGAQYPNLLSYGPTALTLHQAAAPESTLRILCYCLVAGCLLIFPPLFYLMKIFKLQGPAGAAGGSEKA